MKSKLEIQEKIATEAKADKEKLLSRIQQLENMVTCTYVRMIHCTNICMKKACTDYVIMYSSCMVVIRK